MLNLSHGKNPIVVAFAPHTTMKDLTGGALREKPLFFVPRPPPTSIAADSKAGVHARWWPGEEPRTDKRPKA